MQKPCTNVGCQDSIDISYHCTKNGNWPVQEADLPCAFGDLYLGKQLKGKDCCIGEAHRSKLGAHGMSMAAAETHLNLGAAAAGGGLLVKACAHMPAAQDVPSDLHAVASIWPAQAHGLAPSDS